MSLPSCPRLSGASSFLARVRGALLFAGIALLAAGAQAREYAITPVPAWVAPVAPAAAPGGDAAGGLRYLLIDHQTRDAGRDSEFFTHFVMLATTEAGIDQVANHDVDFDPSYQSLALHTLTVIRDGVRLSRMESADVRVLAREKNLENRIYDGALSVHVVLDDIRVGDAVEVAFTLRGSNPIFDGREFGRYWLAWGMPVERQHARLLHPAARPLHLVERNGAPKPRVRELGGEREYVWTRDRVEPLEIEDDVPGWFSAHPYVSWSEYADWNAVARWAAPLYAPAPLGPALRAEADAIRRSTTTPEARLLRALRLVQGQVRYLGIEIGAGSYAPRSPDTVFARRFGDCKDKTLLLVSLLQALDVRAQAALVNTSTLGRADVQPNPAAFDHVIVRADIGGKTYWLDPTRSAQQAGLDALVQPDFGRALVVDPATTGFTEMKPSPAPERPRRVEVEIDASAGYDKPARMTVTSTNEGEAAETGRERMDAKRPEELQKDYLNYYATYYPGIRVAAPMSREDDLDRNRLVIVEHYEIDGFWPRTKDDGGVEASVWSPEMEDYLRAPSSTQRVGPLALHAGLDFALRTTIHLPDEWSDTRETLAVEDPHFRVERTVEGKGNRFVITDTYDSLADHVPQAAVPAYAANLTRARDQLGYSFTHFDDATPTQWLERFNWTVAMILVLLLALLSWAARRAYRYDPAPRNGVTDPQLTGLGGWLVVVGFGLVVSPFRIVWDLFGDADVYAMPSWIALTHPGGDMYNPLWEPLLLGGLAMNTVLVVLSVLVLVLFFQRRSSMPHAYVALLAAHVVFNAIDLAGTYAVAPDNSAEGIKALVQVIGSGAIWGTYILVSKRVRSTFTRRYREAPSTSAAPPAPGAGNGSVEQQATETALAEPSPVVS